MIGAPTTVAAKATVVATPWIEDMKIERPASR